MKILLHLRSLLKSGLMACVLATPTSPAFANDRGLRVAFPEVPGIHEIQAGRYDDAIDILERSRYEHDPERAAETLTTLCGAYVVLRRYDAAHSVCDEAVAKDDSDAAYNNRGVLRVYLGDTDGALEDFARVRVPPGEVEDFIEKLKTSSPRLMASNNFEVIRDIRAEKQRQARGASLTRPGAKVEDIDR